MKTNFRLNSITGSLVAAGLIAAPGLAFAANNIVPSFSTDGPKKGANMFVGANGTKFRITATYTAAETGDATVDLYYLLGAGTSTQTVCTQLGVVDSNASTGAATFAGTLNCATSAFDRVVFVYTTGSDFIDAGSTNIGAIDKDGGALVNTSSAANSAATAAAADTATNSVAAVATYTGPIVTSAAQAAGANGTVALVFNSNLSGSAAGGSGTSGIASVATTANAGVLAKKTLDGSDVTTGAFLSTSTAALDAVTVGNNTTTGFTSAVNKVAIAASGTSNLFDSAGNGVFAETVQAVFTAGAPALASSGGTVAKAIITNIVIGQTSAQLLDAWNATSTTNGIASALDVTIRFNETIFNNGAITAGTGTTTPLTLPAGVTLTSATVGGALSTDLVLRINTAGEFGFDSQGRLLVSTDGLWTTSSLVTVGINDSTAANDWLVTASSTPMTASIAPVNIFAGPTSVPAPGLWTLDSDVDGFLDGYTLSTHNLFSTTTGVAVTSAQPTLSGTTGVSLVAVGGTNPTFASTVASVSGGTGLNVILTNKVLEDWDGNGSIAAADASEYNLARFGTGVITAGAGTIPYTLNIAGVAATSAASGITYGQAFRGTDGNLLPVRNLETSTAAAAFTDNAKPVVVKVDYSKQTSTAEAAAGVTDYGTMTLHMSEAVQFQNTIADNGTIANGASTISNILVGGQPVTLFNLDFNVPQKAQASIGNGSDPKNGAVVANAGVVVNFTPNPVGKLITFSNTGPDIGETGVALTTDPDLLAVVNAVPAANTVVAASNPALVWTSATLAAVFNGTSKINGIVLNYNQNVTTTGTAADLDGIFQVRARVGETRGGIFDNRSAVNPPPSGSVDSFYDFYIPGANVLVGTAGLGGAASVTLLIPDTNTTGGLPSDTKAIFVDYEGSASTSSKSNIRAVAGGALQSIGSGDVFNGNPVVTAAPGALQSSATVFSGINIDADTKTVSFSPIQLATNVGNVANGMTKKLLTQSIIGKATSNGTLALANNTVIRADLLVYEDTAGLAGTAGVDGNVTDGGSVDVFRGPNSESGDAQTVALKNNALSTKDLSGYAKAIRDFNAAVKALPAGVSATRANELVKPARDVLINQFNVPFINFPNAGTTTLAAGDVDNLDGGIFGYVEVTTGAGALASTGNNGANTNNSNGTASGTGEAYSQNANAEFGRTATLSRALPNVRANGTTYYPVRISLVDGSINPLGGNNGLNGGQLNGVFAGGAGILGTAASGRQRGFRVRDTAFALVKNGTYSVIVGADEAAFTATTNALAPNPGGKDPFVQLSVFTGGEYKLATQADPSMKTFVKFAHDLGKSVNVPTKLDINTSAIGETRLLSINGWQIAGLVGEMDRNSATAPIQGQFFMTADPVLGQPIANFLLDNKSKDEAFTLGLNPALVPNELKVAFDSTGDAAVVNIIPRAGAGLAFNYNVGFAIGTNGGTGPSTMDAELAAAGDGRLNDVVSTYATGLKVFYPIKATFPTNTKLLKNSWHLITMQTAKTFATLNPGIDAIIIVNGQTGAKAWFKGEAATAALDTTVLAKGDAIFVHTGSTDVTNFGF